MSDALLQVDDLVAGYTDVNVLHGVSITVRPAEIVSIIGPNGAGKSTFVKAISGLLPPRAGRIDFGGKNITRSAPHLVLAEGLSYVPQLDNVFPNLTVQENLEIGAHLWRDVDTRLTRVYATFSLLAERRRARAATLSGGQRQMLALGRALMADPRLLALDEPSAGLAPSVVDNLFDTLKQINGTGIAVLLVEQNAKRALAMSHRGYVLDLGRNRFAGTGRELLHDPKVAELYLGGRGRLAAESDEGDGRSPSSRPTTS